MASPSEEPPSQGGFAVTDARTSPFSPVEIQGEVVLSSDPMATTSDPSPPPPSPLEEVLSNRDILTLIFQTFLPPSSLPPDKVARKALLDLALLSRSFCEPALDCLWRHLGSLVPLIRLLPGVIVVEGTYYLSGSSQGLGEVFNNYARRVRSLEIINESGINPPNRVDSSVYVFLTQFLSGSPLLVGLTTLHFELTTQAFSWPTLPILFPCASESSLSEVTLGGQILTDPLSHHIALTLLVSRAPSVKSLTVNDSRGCAAKYGSFFEEGVLRFRNLRTLNFTSRNIPNYLGSQIPVTFLQTLGNSLRYLERLTLDLELPRNLKAKKHSSETPTSEQGSGSAGTVASPAGLHNRNRVGVGHLFPCLHSLDLFHRYQSHVMRCHRVTSLIHNVVSLKLTLRTSWMDNFSITIVNSLAQCPRLRHLSLIEDGSIRMPVDDILSLLTQLKLDELRLEVSQLRQAPLELAECSVAQILAATTGTQEDPEPLRSLTLPQTWENGDASLTLLADVARKARDMERLGISIDSSLTFSKLSDLTSLISDAKVPHPSALKYLKIHDFRTGHHPFTSAEFKAIARYIDTCFPNLMSLTLTSNSNSCAVDPWAHIEHLRVMYQENRLLLSALEQTRA